MSVEHDTVPGQLAEIKERLAAGDSRMANIERQMAENTAITRDIKEVLDAARLGFKVIGGLGVFLKWAAMVASAIGALWAIFHHGPKP